MRILRLALPLVLFGLVPSAVQAQGGEIRQATAGSSKWAALVGVGQYEDTSINPLPYAPGDAKADGWSPPPKGYGPRRRMPTSGLKEALTSRPMTVALRTIDEGQRWFIRTGGQNV